MNTCSNCKYWDGRESNIMPAYKGMSLCINLSSLFVEDYDEQMAVAFPHGPGLNHISDFITRPDFFCNQFKRADK